MGSIRNQATWTAAQQLLKGRLPREDEQIVEWLVDGKSTPEIARLKGTNRSAVWRRVKKIEALLKPSD